METICGNNCPVSVAREHALEITAGMNEHPYGVASGLPTIKEKIDSRFEMMSFCGALEEQSCERSCRMIRAMIYSTSAGGVASDLIKLLPSLGQEI